MLEKKKSPEPSTKQAVVLVIIAFLGLGCSSFAAYEESEKKSIDEKSSSWNVNLSGKPKVYDDKSMNGEICDGKVIVHDPKNDFRYEGECKSGIPIGKWNLYDAFDVLVGEMSYLKTNRLKEIQRWFNDDGNIRFRHSGLLLCHGSPDWGDSCSQPGIRGQNCPLSEDAYYNTGVRKQSVKYEYSVSDELYDNGNQECNIALGDESQSWNIWWSNGQLKSKQEKYMGCTISQEDWYENGNPRQEVFWSKTVKRQIRGLTWGSPCPAYIDGIRWSPEGELLD